MWFELHVLKNIAVQKLRVYLILVFVPLMRNARKIPYLPLWAAKLRLSRKRLGLETRIMSTSYIFRPYPLPKTYRKRDGIWERCMRKVKPPPLAAESLTSTQIIVTRNVLVVRVRARADMPRENTDAIGDATRRKYVNAVTAFKYPPKKSLRAPQVRRRKRKWRSRPTRSSPSGKGVLGTEVEIGTAEFECASESQYAT